MKLVPFVLASTGDLALNHLDYLGGGFGGLLSISLSFMGYNIYFFPFGSIFLLKGILYLREFVGTDSAYGFLSLFYVYLVVETALALFHLELGFGLVSFEFLFYFKFLFIYVIYYKFFFKFSSWLFKFLLLVSFVFWFFLNIVLLFLLYYSIFFDFVLGVGFFSVMGILYLEQLSIIVYLEYLLPLLFLLFLLVASSYYYFRDGVLSLDFSTD